MGSTPNRFQTVSRAGTRGEVIVIPDNPLPAGVDERGAGIGDLARIYAGMAGFAVDVALRSVVCAWHRARIGTTHTYARTARAAQEKALRVREQAVNLQREHPVRVLGVVAGAAFAAGVAIRLWRSRSV